MTKVKTEYLNLTTKGDTDIIDITDEIASRVKGSDIANGTVTVFAPGATAGLTTVEYEPGLIEDLRACFEKIAPVSGKYQHNLQWHDGNGYAHVRASLLGPGITVPIVKGGLTLGTWQQVIFIDFDNRPRKRKLVIQIVGT